MIRLAGYLVMPVSLPCEIRSKFHRAKKIQLISVVKQCSEAERNGIA